MADAEREYDALSRAAPVAPGFDREGIPLIVPLATPEENAFRRMSRARNRRPEVAALDARGAELEGRQRDVTAELQQVHDRLSTAPTSHPSAGCGPAGSANDRDGCRLRGRAE